MAKKTSDGLGIHCACQTLYTLTVKVRTMGIARSLASLVPEHIYSDVRGVCVQERRRNGEKEYLYDTRIYTDTREGNANNVTVNSHPWHAKAPLLHFGNAALLLLLFMAIRFNLYLPFVRDASLRHAFLRLAASSLNSFPNF